MTQKYKKNETLSSNTLFNFIDKQSYFFDKLEYGFAPRFNLEKLNLSLSSKKENVAFPMVCFCDVPMSKLKDHIYAYGKYGIGLTKEWGINNGLNPLMYISSHISSVIKHLDILNNELKKIDNSELQSQFYYLLRYLKLYKGKQNNKEKLFYDEKEWRYLPQLEDSDEIGFFLKEEMYNNSVKKEKANSKLKKYTLNFSPDDIKFLVVPERKNVDSLTKKLKMIPRFQDERVLVNTLSKVITVKEIVEDF